jgi:tripartite-type tricarboxylate transporter receptor subunit TctC
MLRTVLLLICAVALPAAAQDYPTKPIRIIVGYAAGGGNDLIVRVMSQRMSEGLGQPVIVENKPGAQAIIATETVAKAPADGYTILMGPTGPMSMNPATYAKLPYDSIRDFAPISTIGQFPLLVVVSAQSTLHSVKDLIDYAKKNPGKANYGSSAAAFQIATELFKQRTGTEFVHIPYKSSGESVNAVVAGQVTMTICDPPPASGPLRGGTARALAVTSNERHPSWPDLPTLKEAGVPDVEVWLWTAFFAPAKTPPAIVARLQKETARVVRLPDVAAGLAKLGVDPLGGTSQELAQRLARDLAKWTAVAKAANIRNE